MAVSSAGYSGGQQSRPIDLSPLSNAISARNQRMDAVQLPQLQAYGPVGLALLASQGDDAAAGFMDRYYGRGKWGQFIPEVTQTEDGVPTIVPPEGTVWDQEQRRRTSLDFFGMEQSV